jgi:uncharacterized repeat protein (TIGR02543 family)
MGTYDHNAVVNISADASTGSVFAGWAGCDSVAGNVCSLLINADKLVTATFNVMQHTLTLIHEGLGDGSVVSEPPGIDCGTTCSAPFSYGTAVRLVAAARPDYTFGGWTGAGCSGTGDCEVTITSDVTVTATFNSPLSVNEGTYGTQITITDVHFGIKKGKVLMGGLSQKVGSWTDTSVSVTVRKPPIPGETAYDVSIQPKPKGTAAVDLPGGFTVRKPYINPLTSDTRGLPDTQATLKGMWFGTKKGKVYVGGQKCRVTSWTMEPTTGESTIVFVVSKNLGAGVYGLEVENKIGRSLTFGFSVP